MKRPLTPLAHGLIDYGLIAALFVVPSLVGMNKKAIRVNVALGVGLDIYNALTDHGASVKPLIPFKTHYKVDMLNLSSLALLTLAKHVRKDSCALAFHTTFLALATATVFLTDPNPQKKAGHLSE